MASSNRRRRWLPAGLAAIVASLVLVPTADAGVFRGTASGERITLYTDGGGVPTRLRLSGYRADCGAGPYRNFADRGFSFIEPLDEATPESLYDKGPAIKAEDADDPRVGYRILASVRARPAADDRWTGRFRVLVKISFRGDVVDRCREDFRFTLRAR